MNKIISIISVVLLTISCQNPQENKQETKSEPTKEAITRKADHSNTKFALFQSDFDPITTYQKIKDYLELDGMHYPRLVNHQKAAQNVQMELNEVFLMIYGNPKTTTLLIQENPEIAIELPFKVLIYKDAENKTWVMYKDLNYLKELYFIKDPNNLIEKANNLQEGFKKAVYNPIKTTQITDEEIQ
jgi:uncharacterized protein (DUF302 family)